MTIRFWRILRRRPDVADCGEVRRVSSDFVDDGLDALSAERVRGHLEKCAPCRAFIGTLRATLGLLRSAARPAAPASLRQRLLDAAQRQETR